MNAPNIVMLHVTDRPEDVARAILSSRTLHKARPAYGIRIIVNGAALAGLTTDAAPLDVEHLPENATLEACEVGMRAHDIAPDALQRGVSTTASAIAALSDGQLSGAAYIRI